MNVTGVLKAWLWWFSVILASSLVVEAVKQRVVVWAVFGGGAICSGGE